MKYTAEVINLNGKPMIRVKHGPYLVGYFYTPSEVEKRLAFHGVSMADIEIKGLAKATS